MVPYTLDRAKAVLHVRPSGPLRKEDFEELARAVDPYLETSGPLRGLVLETARFPGWENPGAFVRHVRFVRDHHAKVAKVAIVTDSRIGGAAEHIASHFVSARIKHFAAGRLADAMAWIDGESSGERA